MKLFLRLCLFTGFMFASLVKLGAQCTVSNIVIQNVTVTGSTGSTCTVRFDVSFNILNNNGNKYIFIHAWLLADYPNYFKCVDGQTTLNGAIHAPESGDLGNEFLNIGINNNEPTPSIITTYPPDPTVPMTTVGSVERQTLPDGSANIILKGVVTTLPVACGTPVVVVADLWSSQSAFAQVAHCVNCGIMYSAGYLSASGFVNCANLSYNATLTNNTSTSISGFYRIYADVNFDGYFTPAIDTVIRDTTAFTVGASSSISINGSVPSANINQDLFLVVTQTSGSASGASRVFVLPSTDCIPLPVAFRTFTVDRVNMSAVQLRWETATEVNNRGFAVQRNLGSNIWQTVGFVNSQAPGGNSSSRISYSFTDLNTHKGISQYRLRQVDLDNKARYSEVRAVRGEGQSSRTIVYPNPSGNGQVNVVFDSQHGTRNVYLTDSYGRLVGKWESVKGNTIEISNLKDGLYTIRIILRETGNQSVEKILVNAH